MAEKLNDSRVTDTSELVETDSNRVLHLCLQIVSSGVELCKIRQLHEADLPLPFAVTV